MVSTQILFLAFIVIILFLLTLLAFFIDIINRMLSKEPTWSFAKLPPKIAAVRNINRQMNIYSLSESLVNKIIEVCPEDAISLEEESENRLIVSESRCLGYNCLKCLKILHTDQSNK